MDLHSDYNQNGTMTRVTTLHHSDRQIDFIQAGISEQISMKTTINMENTQKHKNTTHNFHGDFQSRGNT